jgi:hypothetical protein
MLSQFDDKTYVSDGKNYALLTIFVIATLFLPIIMLNLLIAIIGDTY